MLGGNKESVEAFTSCIGKTITGLELKSEETLVFTFEDGTRMGLEDQGQSCCEHRYMRTDDKLADFIGAKLLGGEIKPGPDVGGSGEEHNIEFLDITTDRGVFQMVNHNEHNGYYGGFAVRAKKLPRARKETNATV